MKKKNKKMANIIVIYFTVFLLIIFFIALMFNLQKDEESNSIGELGTIKPGSDINVQIPKKCKDSDQGIMDFKFGVVSTPSKRFSDVCIDNKRLKEYYCKDDNVESKVIYCNKCSGGVCIS